MNDKIRYDLVPDEFMDVALVFMAGIKQGYEPNGWKEGKKFEKEANLASIKRHLVDYRKGVLEDKDSKLNPILHAACRCLMQYYLDLKNTQKNVLAELVVENQKLGFYDVESNTLSSLGVERIHKTWDIDFEGPGCITMEEHLENMKKKPNQYFKGDK